MATPNRQSKPYTYRTEQEIANKSFDEQYGIETVAPLGYRSDLDAFAPININPDGTLGRNLALKVVTSGTTTYVGQAAIGSASSAAVWQVMKVDSSSGTSITWANGNDSFNNVWNNYASLTYS